MQDTYMRQNILCEIHICDKIFYARFIYATKYFMRDTYICDKIFDARYIYMRQNILCERFAIRFGHKLKPPQWALTEPYLLASTRPSLMHASRHQVNLWQGSTAVMSCTSLSCRAISSSALREQ